MLESSYKKVQSPQSSSGGNRQGEMGSVPVAHGLRGAVQIPSAWQATLLLPHGGSCEGNIG